MTEDSGPEQRQADAKSTYLLPFGKRSESEALTGVFVHVEVSAQLQAKHTGKRMIRTKQQML